MKKNKATKLAKIMTISGITLFNALLSYAGSDLKTVPYVDLKRYMGDWHVIANIPNFIEKDCVSSLESYALRDDGMIDNWFVCQKKDGTEVKLTSLAWVKDIKTQAEWRIRFNLSTFLGVIPIPLHFKYSIIDLDEVHYSYTVVGHPSRSLLWIMSREKTMDENLYQKILLKVKNQGYEPSKIRRLPVSK